MPFLPSFLVRGAWTTVSGAREPTYLANVENDSIQSSDLDRPIRGSRLFIGHKATIILTLSVLYSDNRIMGQQFSSKELYEFFMGDCILHFTFSYLNNEEFWRGEERGKMKIRSKFRTKLIKLTLFMNSYLHNMIILNCLNFLIISLRFKGHRTIKKVPKA